MYGQNIGGGIVVHPNKFLDGWRPTWPILQRSRDILALLFTKSLRFITIHKFSTPIILLFVAEIISHKWHPANDVVDD